MSDDKSSDTKRDSSPRGEKSDGLIIDAAGDHYEVSEDRKTIGLTSAVFLYVQSPYDQVEKGADPAVSSTG
jgi:hypothetical protein